MLVVEKGMIHVSMSRLVHRFMPGETNQQPQEQEQEPRALDEQRHSMAAATRGNSGTYNLGKEAGAEMCLGNHTKKMI